MAHGEAVQPLESTDGSTVDVTDGEASFKDKDSREYLGAILIENRRQTRLLTFILQALSDESINTDELGEEE